MLSIVDYRPKVLSTDGFGVNISYEYMKYRDVTDSYGFIYF